MDSTLRGADAALLFGEGFAKMSRRKWTKREIYHFSRNDKKVKVTVQRSGEGRPGMERERSRTAESRRSRDVARQQTGVKGRKKFFLIHQFPGLVWTWENFFAFAALTPDPG